MTQKVDVNSLTPEQIAAMSDAELATLVGQFDEDVTEDSSPQSGEKASDDTSDKADEGLKTVAPDAKAEDAKEEQEPVGVATKAGDKIIPYSVLSNTRKEAENAKEQARLEAQKRAEAEAKIAELTAALESKSNVKIDAVELFTEEQLKELEEQATYLEDDLPEVAAVIRKMQAAYTATASALQSAQAELDETARKSVVNTVQEAIDSVPKLAHIQVANPRLFRLATEIDAELRANPAMAALTMSQRFEKVVAQLESDLGIEIKLPSQQGKQGINIEKQSGINSIDDIGGGSSPVADEIKAILELPPHELDARFAKMTEAQQQEFMARAAPYL